MIAQSAVAEAEALSFCESPLDGCNRTIATVCVVPFERLGDPVAIIDANSDFISPKSAPPITLRNRALNDWSVLSGDIVCRTVNGRSVAHYSNHDSVGVLSGVVNGDVPELERLVLGLRETVQTSSR